MSRDLPRGSAHELGLWAACAAKLTRFVFIGLVSVAGACGESPSDVRHEPIPPPGPHFSVVPLRLETIAHISPIGSNNKVFPTAHTYWHTCDVDGFGTRPCHLERQQLFAPGSGIVRGVDAQADGTIVVEGPPGLHWHFGHVTPAALNVGDSVRAGQHVATMFYEHGFDFGLWNRGVTHAFVSPDRYPLPTLHAEHPIAQYPAAMRNELVARMTSTGAWPLGRVSLDVPGTAAGGWFILGAPAGMVPLQFGNEHMTFWLGRFVERPTTRIAIFGEFWPGMQNRRFAVDPGAPDWEAITRTSGPVAIKLWNPTLGVQPNFDWPGGTLLLELVDSTTLRMEWFDTHEPVTGFAAAVKTYVR